MQRREFITLLGGAAAASSSIWPHAACAQQRSMPVVGLLTPRGKDDAPHLIEAVRQGLRDAGFVEGRNVAIEYRFAENQNERLPDLAADLVRRQVSVIVAFPTPAVLAAKAVTSTIPIVFQVGVDPVAAGLVASLNRPGGNLTGVTNLSAEVQPKRLELLHELLPTATSAAVLQNRTFPLGDDVVAQLQAAARAFGLQLHLLDADSDRDFDSVFSKLAELRADGLVISPDAFFSSRNQQLAELTLRYKVPAVSELREFTAGGGLMAYGSRIVDGYRVAGTYAGRILKDDKPAELPVQQATTMELFINMKTARTLDISFPTAILVRADEVFE